MALVCAYCRTFRSEEFREMEQHWRTCDEKEKARYPSRPKGPPMPEEVKVALRERAKDPLVKARKAAKKEQERDLIRAVTRTAHDFSRRTRRP